MRRLLQTYSDGFKKRKHNAVRDSKITPAFANC